MITGTTDRHDELEREVGRGRALGGVSPVQSSTLPTLAPRDRATIVPARKEEGGAEADRFERETARTQKRIAMLKIEMDTLGQGTYARERARMALDLETAAKEANTKAGNKNTGVTAEQRRTIDQLANAYATAATQAEQAKERQQELREGAREFGSAISDAFKSAVLNGEKLDSVLADLSSRFLSRGIDKLFDMMLFGGSSASANGGLFGSLFGGFRADGGPVSRSMPYVVGERGPELFVPGTSGRVVPNGALAGAMRAPAIGGAPSIVSAPTVNVSVEGGSRGPQADNELAAKIGRELEGSLKGLVANELRTQMRPGGMLRP